MAVSVKMLAFTLRFCRSAHIHRYYIYSDSVDQLVLDLLKLILALNHDLFLKTIAANSSFQPMGQTIDLIHHQVSPEIKAAIILIFVKSISKRIF